MWTRPYILAELCRTSDVKSSPLHNVTRHLIKQFVSKHSKEFAGSSTLYILVLLHLCAMAKDRGTNASMPGMEIAMASTNIRWLQLQLSGFSWYHKIFLKAIGEISAWRTQVLKRGIRGPRAARVVTMTHWSWQIMATVIISKQHIILLIFCVYIDSISYYFFVCAFVGDLNGIQPMVGCA